MAETTAGMGPGVGGSDASPRQLRRLAWGLGILALLILAAAGSLVVLNRSAIHSFDQADPTDVIVPIGYAVIGALLAARRARNPIGWIFLGIAITGGLSGLSTEYVFRNWHVHRLPLVAWVGWTHDWLAWLAFPAGLATFFFLLFPDGHLQSRRWRMVAWFAGGVTARTLEQLYFPGRAVLLEKMPDHRRHAALVRFARTVDIEITQANDDPIRVLLRFSHRDVVHHRFRKRVDVGGRGAV